MARLIEAPARITAVGTREKIILEYIGRVHSGTSDLSLARMDSPAGWSGPGQTPEFDEFTLVLDGTLRVETRDGVLEATAGQAVMAPRNEWVRYSTSHAGGARYIAVCRPAFSPETVHRDE
ncbi:MAG: cupin [Acidobacteria bacterium]|nr:cupin [Acidobacteriota bacterium]